MSPYEQNTQQSPGFGRTMVRQTGQLQKATQAVVGISSEAVWPHDGQVIVESRIARASSILGESPQRSP